MKLQNTRLNKARDLLAKRSPRWIIFRAALCTAGGRRTEQNVIRPKESPVRIICWLRKQGKPTLVWWIRKVLFSGKWHRLVRQKCTDVAEECRWISTWLHGITFQTIILFNGTLHEYNCNPSCLPRVLHFVFVICFSIISFNTHPLDSTVIVFTDSFVFFRALEGLKKAKRWKGNGSDLLWFLLYLVPSLPLQMLAEFVNSTSLIWKFAIDHVHPLPIFTSFPKIHLNVTLLSPSRLHKCPISKIFSHQNWNWYIFNLWNSKCFRGTKIYHFQSTLKQKDLHTRHVKHKV